MTEELHGPVTIPSGMIVGNIEPFSVVGTRTPVWVAYLFGTKGDAAPGWWILGEPAAQHGLPLAGPYDSKLEAVQDIVATEAAWRKHHSLAESGYYGFMSGSAALFQPTVVLNPHHLVMGRRARVDSYVKIESGELTYIGDFVHIASFCHLNIGGGVLVMEEGSSAGSGARILSGSALLGHGSCSATHPSVRNAKSKTIIRRNATVFAGATVSVGCELGEGSALGGGSFLKPHTTVPAGELWAGVPAVFKKKITPVEPRQ